MALAANSGTCIQFSPVTRCYLELAVGRAISLRQDRHTRRRMQLLAMATDVGWTRPAKQYAALYRDLAARRANRP
jgi:starch synthase